MDSDPGRSTGRRLAIIGLEVVAIIAVIAGVIIFKFVVLASSDTEIVGRTGVSVDTQGNPVLVVTTCRGSVDRLYLDGKLPDDHSRQSGDRTWATSSRINGSDKFSVFGAPPPGWTSSGSEPPLRSDYIYIAFAQSADHRQETSQVNFYQADLEQLTTTSVLADGKVIPLSAFRDQTCAELH
jgi:hypothetical protein